MSKGADGGEQVVLECRARDAGRVTWAHKGTLSRGVRLLWNEDIIGGGPRRFSPMNWGRRGRLGKIQSSVV